MNGTHGSTAVEDDPDQELPRRQSKIEWNNGGARWEQNANVVYDFSNWG